MTSDEPLHPRHDSVVTRLPTGAKLLLILSAALLPLALISVFAALQTTRDDDLERRAELRIATTQSARALSIELLGDMTALKEALDAIESDPSNTPICARVRGVMAQGLTRGVRFGIFDRDGTLRCGTAITHAATVVPGERTIVANIVDGKGLSLGVAGSGGAARAIAFFPGGFLASISTPVGYDLTYGSTLQDAGGRLALRALPLHRLARRDTARAMLGLDQLALTMTVRSEPISSAVRIAMALPILMWMVAVGIAWLVVDRLIVRPLQRLRAGVSAYVPSELFDPAAIGQMPAQEIRQLGETFRALSGTIQAHEKGLAEGLIRQTKLTREVHHRVKNNLQVIASLINFHSRSAGSPEVAQAYASIQRRVDALAVVHRNHFAELEVHRGLGLRPMIGELAANIRATAPDDEKPVGIVIDIDPFLVTQDVAVAVSFLATEAIELAMSAQPGAQIHISVKSVAGDAHRALLRIGSPALVATDRADGLLATRYDRVMQGLARQLRSKLDHDPVSGVFEIAIAVTGRD